MDPLVVHVLLKLVISMTKQNLLVKSSSKVLFTAENIAEAMYLIVSPHLGQVTQFNPKMQDFQRVLDLTCK